MSNIKIYTKLPVKVRAIQYTNPEDVERIGEIVGFAGAAFRVRNDWERKDSIITAEIYDELHDTWVGVKNGDYIIEGLSGEFFPHDEALFPQTYIESWEQEAWEMKQELPPL
jgi:hypothetical protein